ncbi:sigma-E factor negative regulatory protein [Sinimarinibacterium thermocellulolyticum]|uniref:Sigma-E factor negative regulatory protein n=1 Tax=Sinimarinibacterium thermocellulolyticum TaxID=3170016 RepID=A0ABV2A8M5_9GAMM
MAKDSLSALLDGECSPDELDRILDEMQRSPELKATWSRLCLGRDAREGVIVRKAQPCICAEVMRRLDAQDPAPRAKVVPLVAAAAPRRWTRWKPALGLAAAACVAAVAVTIGVQAPSDPAAAPGLAEPQRAMPVAAPSKGGRAGALQVVSAGAENLPQQALSDELRQYMIEHSSALADRGMGATLSYARFAAHSAGDSGLQPVSFGVSGEKP